MFYKFLNFFFNFSKQFVFWCFLTLLFVWCFLVSFFKHPLFFLKEKIIWLFPLLILVWGFLHSFILKTFVKVSINFITELVWYHWFCIICCCCLVLLSLWLSVGKEAVKKTLISCFIAGLVFVLSKYYSLWAVAIIATGVHVLALPGFFTILKLSWTHTELIRRLPFILLKFKACVSLSIAGSFVQGCSSLEQLEAKVKLFVDGRNNTLNLTDQQTDWVWWAKVIGGVSIFVAGFGGLGYYIWSNSVDKPLPTPTPTSTALIVKELPPITRLNGDSVAPRLSTSDSQLYHETQSFLVKGRWRLGVLQQAQESYIRRTGNLPILYRYMPSWRVTSEIDPLLNLPFEYLKIDHKPSTAVLDQFRGVDRIIECPVRGMSFLYKQLSDGTLQILEENRKNCIFPVVKLLDEDQGGGNLIIALEDSIRKYDPWFQFSSSFGREVKISTIEYQQFQKNGSRYTQEVLELVDILHKYALLNNGRLISPRAHVHNLGYAYWAWKQWVLGDVKDLNLDQVKLASDIHRRSYGHSDGVVFGFQTYGSVSKGVSVFPFLCHVRQEDLKQ